MRTSSINLQPPDDTEGWWLLKIAPGMTVDDEFMQELMRINREFNARKKQEGFEDMETRRE